MNPAKMQTRRFSSSFTPRSGCGQCGAGTQPKNKQNILPINAPTSMFHCCSGAEVSCSLLHVSTPLSDCSKSQTWIPQYTELLNMTTQVFGLESSNTGHRTQDILLVRVLGLLWFSLRKLSLCIDLLMVWSVTVCLILALIKLYDDFKLI